MKKNMGGFDVIVRRGLGLALCLLYFFTSVSGTAGAVLFVGGGALIYTTLEGFCPVYAVLGISTLSRRTKHPMEVRGVHIFFPSPAEVIYFVKKGNGLKNVGKAK